MLRLGCSRQSVIEWRGLLTALLTGCLMMSACSGNHPNTMAARGPKPSPTPVAEWSDSSPTAIAARFTYFRLPYGTPALTRVVKGPDGALWFTANDSQHVEGQPFSIPFNDSIVRMTTAGAVNVFPLPNADSRPDGITAGPDGNLWFTESDGNAVGRITPHGTITEFLVPPRSHRSPMGSLPFSQPHAIAVGPDDNLWVPDGGGNRIWRITPAGVLTSFSIPAHAENPGGGYPYGIAAGPGGAVWFTEVTGMRIGRLTMDGHITEFKLPGVNHIPSDIVVGSNGAVWFLEPNQSDLGRITIGGQITEFALPHASCFSPGTQTASEYGDCQVEDLTLGSDGAVWFSEQWNQALGRMDERGHVTEFRLPAALTISGPTALTSGPDGALWFVYDRGVARWSL